MLELKIWVEIYKDIKLKWKLIFLNMMIILIQARSQFLAAFFPRAVGSVVWSSPDWYLQVWMQ